MNIEMIKSLEFWMLIVQICTLIALIIYTCSTWRMAFTSRDSVEEMKKMREQEFSPYVVAYFDVPYGKFEIGLVVKNIGKTPAKNVKLKFDPPLINSFQGEKINEVGFIKDGIKMLPPNYEVRTFIDSTFDYFNEKKELPLQYTVLIDWFDENGKAMNAEWMLDLSSYYNRLFSSEKGIHELVEVNEKMKQIFEKIEANLSEICNILSEGLWFKTFGFENSEEFSSKTWEYNILAKLNSYKILWQSIYAKDTAKLVNVFLRNLKSIIASLGIEILKTVSIHFDNIPLTIKKELCEVAKNLLELGSKRFYNTEEFNKLGDEILNIVEELIRSCHSIKEKP